MSELKLNYTRDEIYADFEDTPISYVQKLLQDWLSLYSAYNAMMNIANDYATERDKLQAEIDTLQKRLNVAVHLNEDTAEGFDWAVLDKAFQLDELRKRIKEAVGEIYAIFDDECKSPEYGHGALACEDILRKHGLIEEDK